MDIKKLLRKALLEGKHKNHKKEYGCVMVYLDVNKKDWNSILDLIDDEDLYEPEDDPTYGKENKPHVTILFGLHSDVPDSDIEKEISKIKTPKIEFEGISAFKNELFEVLKFDVKSDDLHKHNKRFREYPHTNNFKNYHPHCTIAYLKPNMSEKYIKKLNEIKDINMKSSHIVYSKVDGTKKTYNFK